MVNILGTNYTEQELLTGVRQIRDGYWRNGNLSPTELDFMTAIFDRHPRPDKLDGAKRNGGRLILKVSGKGFKFVNKNGMWERISFKSCCMTTPKDSTPREKFIEACRLAIRNETTQARLDGIGTKCPISGTLLTEDNVCTHHQGKSFAEIIDQFIMEHDLDITKLHYNLNHRKDFSDSDLRIRFKNYHQEYADLIAISIDAHKEIHKGK